MSQRCDIIRIGLSYLRRIEARRAHSKAVKRASEQTTITQRPRLLIASVHHRRTDLDPSPDDARHWRGGGDLEELCLLDGGERTGEGQPPLDVLLAAFIPGPADTDSDLAECPVGLHRMLA